jgi:hypothetical protein
VKQLLTVAFASLILVGPVLADESSIRANCSAEILKSTDATRNDLKSFRIIKHGGGYEMSGQTETNRTVTCQADADGHVNSVIQR